VKKKDREVLRRLAERVAEIAAEPEQAARREMWYAHNALKGGKPIVLAFPEGGWRELLPEETLSCEDKVAREWEMELRQTIYTHERIRDDRVVERVFNIHYVATAVDWGVTIEHVKREQLGSYTWKPPLKELSDIKKMRFRGPEVDVEETNRRAALAKEIFGDVLAVRIRGMFWWTLGMTWTAILLRGLERLMLDMYDNPEWLKELMTILRDGTMRELDYLEANGFLTLNNEGDYVGSGGFGYTKELPAAGYEGRVRTKDMWGFAESQEFVSVSPEKFEEFAFEFQLPILERFGINCYGCCEPLHTRFQVVKRTPRLRRVSISAWCNLEIAARELEDKYIFSYKPNPAMLAGERFHEDEVRKALEDCLEAARGCKVEMIMKDTHTFRGEPRRIERWVEIAQEVAEKYS
jgi:hypothetical protein